MWMMGQTVPPPSPGLLVTMQSQCSAGRLPGKCFEVKVLLAVSCHHEAGMPDTCVPQRVASPASVAFLSIYHL